MALALSSSPLATVARCGSSSIAAKHNKSSSFVVAKKARRVGLDGAGAVRLPSRAGATGAVRLPASSSSSSFSAAAVVADDVVTPEVVLGGVATMMQQEQEQELEQHVEVEKQQQKKSFHGFCSMATAAGVLALGGLLALPPHALADVTNAVAPIAAEEGSLTDGFLSAFLLIFFSEIGDKTFFIAVLLALQQVRRTSGETRGREGKDARGSGASD